MCHLIFGLSFGTISVFHQCLSRWFSKFENSLRMEKHYFDTTESPVLSKHFFETRIYRIYKFNLWLVEYKNFPQNLCCFTKKRVQRRCFHVTIANFLRTAIMKDICDWLHLVIICLWLVRIPLVWSQYIKSTFTDYMLSLLFLRTKLATFSKKDHKTSNKPNTLVQRFNLYLCFYQDISETRTNP